MTIRAAAQTDGTSAPHVSAGTPVLAVNFRSNAAAPAVFTSKKGNEMPPTVPAVELLIGAAAQPDSNVIDFGSIADPVKLVTELRSITDDSIEIVDLGTIDSKAAP